MSVSRVVVTGGCGFIGAHLVDRLLADGNEVVVFDDAPAGPGRVGGAGGDRCRHVVGDVRDPDRLAEAITPGVDVVYHLAALVGVDRYLASPLDVIDVNFGGTRNVLDRALAVGARVVVASSSEVFGKNPAVPWREESDRLVGPTTTERWTYSTSKALAEHLVFAFTRQFGLPATVVRFFNAYGPGQRPAFVVSRSVHRILNGRAPVLYDKGRQTRCFTYVDDIVGGTVLAGTVPAALGQVFNIGSMVETTVGEVVELIARIAGFEGESRQVETVEAFGAAYEDLERRVPDSRKALAMLGWSADTSLEQGLAKVIAWARENEWWTALPDSGA